MFKLHHSISIKLDFICVSLNALSIKQFLNFLWIWLTNNAGLISEAFDLYLILVLLVI